MRWFEIAVVFGSGEAYVKPVQVENRLRLTKGRLGIESLSRTCG